MKISSFFRRAAGGALAVAAFPALAALNGTSMEVQYYYPDPSTPYAEATATPSAFVIGAGVESTMNVEDVTFFDIDFSDSSLTLDFTTLLTDPTWVSRDFNGVVFTGIGLESFRTVTIDPGSTFGIGAGGITLSGNQLSLDWGGVSYRDGQSLTLNFGAVPEPASWAMMIGGFGLIGVALRRRRAALAA